ncbi:dihydrolipoamide acetyltransferase family protein [Gulosibacter bifidus]|uniref:Dihydrolipoamide acetyltransferase component of pyruvate dehydrogenase complex n=1 Tax=Gulosibacter bifidus TaxID=272239 RepID=A0ABW5RJM3_9MICO|nr:dihydrolipoamide acetyltransferase family protein [Gulosibacter bifidus]
MTAFNLPDVGEGLTEATIVQWRVAVGDTVAVNDVLVEIETAKSLVELSSPFAGTVTELCVAEGEEIEVGTRILEVAETAGADSGAASDSPSSSADATTQASESGGANLVGYGTVGAPSSRRSKRRAASAPQSTPAAAATPQAPNCAAKPAAAVSAPAAPPASTAPAAPSAHTTDRQRVIEGQAQMPAGTGSASVTGLPVLAKPPIRKLAKDLGVDLNRVQPSGKSGEITRQDVVLHAEQARVFHNIETPEWGDQREERHRVTGVRKQIAQNMVRSMFTAPHVTLFVDVDATRTMEYVKRLKASPDYADTKISPLLIVAKAVIWAIRRNPTTNATWTDEEYIVKNYVNLGIAAATPRGLLVPNIKDAHTLSMRQLAKALETLTITAREGKTTPTDQQQGTFTITNVGVFGVDTGTPVLMPGEVGILAFGAVRPKPWVVNGEVQVRQVTTVAASFDHRLVDGDVASRFVADVATILEEPALLLD